MSGKKKAMTIGNFVKKVVVENDKVGKISVRIKLVKMNGNKEKIDYV